MHYYIASAGYFEKGERQLGKHGPYRNHTYRLFDRNSEITQKDHTKVWTTKFPVLKHFKAVS